ncbi:T9SS type A sorting domain-containing protein [Dyadobacter aurulentus]|uniref:T9SS type A sorting domain-containing protein n=1 Tax=Dyadobacter sp. UC 10 TaxID=2605428 RepID=UPI0011F1A092|nr:T9SS type A sorting domain-containing protein [Dyadobacter sp. UC 10]KAA0993509.1 T9SS type A sorting domain-containing protein [Dyadobacter sp. UC 10]
MDLRLHFRRASYVARLFSTLTGSTLGYCIKMLARRQPGRNLFPVLIAFGYFVTNANAQTCATVERFQTTTFARPSTGTGGTVPIAGYSQNNWQGSGAGNIDRGPGSIYFSDNTNTQTFTQAVSNVNLKGTGATFSMTFSAFNGNSLSFPYDGNQSDLRISYAGVLYATISTSNGTATTGAGTVAFFNGAVNSTNGSNASYNYDINANGGAGFVHTLSLRLPTTIPNSGSFTVVFVPNANAIDPRTFSDDYNVFTASLLSCPIIYSGTILDDANALTDNLVNGSPINTASVAGLQVALYDGSGNIVAGTTTNVNADGTYSISHIGTGTYTVRLLNLPSTYVNTGESSNGTGTIPDGTADGIVSAYTILNANTNTDKPNGNIGIQQPPQTAVSSIPAQPNPGGSVAVAIPATAFTISTTADPNTGDAAPGVVNYIRITSFPANATSIVIDGVSFTSLAAINLVYPNGIPTDASGAPTVSVGVDPVDGAVTVVLPIAAVDNGGAQDPTPGSITVPFSDALVSVSGNVWNDANGEATKDGSEPFTNGGGLFANLTDASGAVVASVPVDAATGAYSFSNVSPNTAYSIVLTETGQTNGTILTASDLPDGWENTGVNLGGTADPGNKTGVIALTTSTTDVSSANFGIEQTPTADDKTISNLPNSTFSSMPPSGFPPVTDYVAVAMSDPALLPLSGSDPEDCAAAASCSTGSTFIIESINTANTKLYYDFGGAIGVQEVIPGTSTGVIPNFDPAKMVIYGAIGSGNSTSPLEFTYQLVDAAGIPSLPATYLVSTESSLPVVLSRFTVKESESHAALLNWTTTAETNSQKFDIQHSADAKTWDVIASVDSKGESKDIVDYSYTHTSPFPGENLYRLKMVDLDGTFTYSRIERVSFAVASLYPNPASDKIVVSFLGEGTNDVTGVSLITMDGRYAYSANKLVNGTIDVRNLAAGTYIVAITFKGGTVRTSKIVIVR